MHHHARQIFRTENNIIESMDKRLAGSACALGCEVLYGLSYIFTRHVSENTSGFALLGWRFLIAFLVINLLVLVGIVRIDLHRKNLKQLLAVAAFSPCIYFIAETFGIRNTTATESSVMLACIPAVSLLASSILLKKKPYSIQLTGILITLIGVVITVIAAGVSSSLSISGYAALAVAVVSYALYSVYVDKASGCSEMEITYVMLASGALLFVLLAIAEAAVSGSAASLMLLPFRNRDFLIAILYQGIGCSILAFFLSNAAISRIGVNGTSSFVGASTAVSILAGTFLLSEPFTVYKCCRQKTGKACPAG